MRDDLSDGARGIEGVLKPPSYMRRRPDYRQAGVEDNDLTVPDAVDAGAEIYDDAFADEVAGAAAGLRSVGAPAG